MCPHVKIKRKPVKIYIFVDDSITDSSLYDIIIPKDGFAQGSIALTRNQNLQVYFSPDYDKLTDLK